jgi:2'-hydroxyisoflavone reductase
MKVLILGGTQFIGRHIAETLIAGGHSVSIFNRGCSPDALPESIMRYRGDRDEGLAGLLALEGHSWDVCVDVSGYLPRQVRASAEWLHDRVNRYVFISAVRVYGDPAARPVCETHPTLPPAGGEVTEIDDATYGPLKVACENIVQEVYGSRATLLRPQVVTGPHDPSGRYAYWVQRAALPGPMLAPGDGSDHLQVIDVRDLAQFTRRVIERDIGGIFNLAGPRLSWLEFIQLLGARNVVWVPASIIEAAGLTFQDLPLYRPERGTLGSLMDLSHARADAAGLTLTAPAETMNTMRAWLQGKEPSIPLSLARDAELILMAGQRAK